MVIALSVMLLLWVGAWVVWNNASTEHQQMKATIDAIAPDGNVETYDVTFHRRLQRNMRWTAWVMVFLGALTVPLQRAFSGRRSRKKKEPTTIKQDLRSAFRRYNIRTSPMHKRMVLLVIVIGAILRAFLLREPIIYDEAFTYTYFASRPFWVIISDYSYPNNHIFHTLLVKMSTGVFGVGLVPLRLPAFLAGVVAMPLVYIFTRAMFNRYIAFTALCLVAGMGGLVEYSALARGYSITWVCFLCCLILGRHFAKYNSTSSALLMGVVAALGMWTIPTMIYSAVAVYLWLILYLLMKYESSIQDRINKLVYSMVIAVGLTMLLYAPVVIVHNVDQLFYHPTMGEATWESFMATHQDRVGDVWGYVIHSSSSWYILILFISVLYASFVSSKFRILLGAVILSAVPIILLRALLPPPRVWNYVQFVVAIGGSIGLFYLLKFIQDKLFTSFHKRTRTLVSGILLLATTGYLSLRTIPERLNRRGDAQVAAKMLTASVDTKDRVFVAFPWEAPIEFHMLQQGAERDALYREPGPDNWSFVLVGPAEGQTVTSVLERHDVDPKQFKQQERIAKLEKLELYRGKIKD